MQRFEGEGTTLSALIIVGKGLKYLVQYPIQSINEAVDGPNIKCM